MPDYAQPFADMVARISKIDPAEFAGAIVLVLPGDGGDIAFYTADPKPDVLQFLAAVKTRVEIRERELMQAVQAQDPWGQRR